MQLNDNIKLIRELSGVKQEDFAKLIKTNPSNLKTYENTNTKAKAPVLAAIADIAGITVEELKKKKLTHKDVKIVIGQGEKDDKDENSNHKPQEAQHGQDYKDRYLELLEELANSNGKQLLQLAKMNQALLKTVLRALAAIQAKGEKRKLSDILIELNNQTEQYLLALRKEGT